MTWHAMLRGGLCNFSDSLGTTVIRGVRVERLRPRCPALFLSGATPGQFYHSHPHVPSEFDHLNFSMEAQVRSNITTIHKIGHAVLDYSHLVPFNFEMNWLRSPYLLHWISGNGNGFVSNRNVVEAVGPAIATELGMDNSHVLGMAEVGDNVSDRRFLLETFGMFPLSGSDDTGPRGHLRIDIKEEFDPQYFMPYVPGYLSYGQGDLALFCIRAAPEGSLVPADGPTQVSMLWDELLLVLEELGSSFEDLIVGWARVPFLNEDEEAVLMTRSKKGLTRPLAESVLGLASSDQLGEAHPGVPWRLEYVVLAQIPPT